MERRYNDIFIGTFLLAFSIMMFTVTFRIEGLTDSQVGPDFMPRIISILIAVTSISIIVSGFKRRNISEADTDEVLILDESEKSANEDSQNKNKFLPNRKSYLSVVLTVMFMFGYFALMPTLGFLITTIIYLLLQMMLFSGWKTKNIVLYIFISIVTSTFIYYVFRNVFYLMLPSGILG